MQVLQYVKFRLHSYTDNWSQNSSWHLCVEIINMKNKVTLSEYRVFLNISTMFCLAPVHQGITHTLNFAILQQSQSYFIPPKSALSWIHQAYSSRSWAWDGYSLHAYFICFILRFIFPRAWLPWGPNFLLVWCQSSSLVNSQSQPRCRNFSYFPVCLATWTMSGWIP